MAVITQTQGLRQDRPHLTRRLVAAWEERDRAPAVPSVPRPIGTAGSIPADITRRAKPATNLTGDPQPPHALDAGFSPDT
jgi:hypothetical protein